MKKNYIIPETMFEDTLNIHSYMQTASDPHINDDGNVEIPGEGGGGNADDGCTKQRNAWEEGGLWTLLLAFLLTMAGSMNLRAQSVTEPDATRTLTGITINLLNNTSVSYNANIDSVRNLPGIGLKIYLSTTADNKSIDYLYSQMAAITYTYSGSVTPVGNNANANWNITGMNIPESGGDPTFTHQSTDAYAWRLEYPHISTSSTSQRVVTATSAYGITYSIEWDNSLVANRWTVYTMCAKNNASNTDRHDDFKADPAVTTSPTSSYTNSSTYSRGHLCPSADRLASTEQNKQTFYMTNMQPQYQTHNGGVWATLEGYVRSKWQPTNSTDTLYVVKAATIADVTLNGSTSAGTLGTTTDSGNHTLPVPKYFYMAFLYYDKAQNSYKAFALWTEHLSSGNPSAATVINNRISIDELEARTCIDFFCNLPDDIEATVEATATYWDNSSSAKERFDDDFLVPEEEELDGEEELEIALW